MRVQRSLWQSIPVRHTNVCMMPLHAWQYHNREFQNPKGTASNQRAGIKHWYHLHHTLIHMTMARINSRKSYFKFFSYLPQSNLLFTCICKRRRISKVHPNPLFCILISSHMNPVSKVCTFHRKMSFKLWEGTPCLTCFIQLILQKSLGLLFPEVAFSK